MNGFSIFYYKKAICEKVNYSCHYSGIAPGFKRLLGKVGKAQYGIRPEKWSNAEQPGPEPYTV